MQIIDRRTKQYKSLIKDRGLQSIEKLTNLAYNCKHTTMKNYVRGLCITCYRAYGKVKRATKCKHTERMHYAREVCESCYTKLFRMKKNKQPILQEKKKEKLADK